jgi:hypothetical protein
VRANRGEMEQLKLEIESRKLFEQIINRDELTRAYKVVKANKGAPGIDGITVEAFGAHLHEEITRLIEEITTWTYRPKPVRRVMIPKPGSTKERPLGIPCVRDRVVLLIRKRSATCSQKDRPPLDTLWITWSKRCLPPYGKNIKAVGAKRRFPPGTWRCQGL